MKLRNGLGRYIVRSDLIYVGKLAGMDTYTDPEVPKGHVKIIHDDGREELVAIQGFLESEKFGEPQKKFEETFKLIQAIDNERVFFPRPDPGLGEPQRKFSETFSGMDAIRERLNERMKSDNPLWGSNFQYK